MTEEELKKAPGVLHIPTVMCAVAVIYILRSEISTTGIPQRAPVVTAHYEHPRWPRSKGFARQLLHRRGQGPASPRLPRIDHRRAHFFFLTNRPPPIPPLFPNPTPSR